MHCGPLKFYVGQKLTEKQDLATPCDAMVHFQTIPTIHKGVDKIFAVFRDDQV